MGFDGHHMMDQYEGNRYEYKIVTASQMKNSKYGEDNEWITLRQPKEGTVGIIARTMTDQTMTPGVGLGVNRFQNGMYLSEEDSKAMQNTLDVMTPSNRVKYMNTNSIVKAGNRYRIILDEDTKVDKLGMKQSVAHTMMRTYAHQLELVQMQSVRDIITKKATEVMTADSIDKLDATLKNNEKLGVRGDTVEVPMFLKLDFDYGTLKDLPAYVKRYYKVPSNLSSYNGLNRKITLVKKGEADIMMGHKNFSFFGGTEYRTAAKWESGFKQLIVMAKQHMVVASASKLAVDLMSNFGVLSAKDVSLMEMKKYVPEGFKEYNDFTRKRSEIVALEIQARMGTVGAKDKLDKAKIALTKHKFYNAFMHGFVQSYSTSLITQNFDSLSGLQKNIDYIIDGITTDEKGEANAIHRAIKTWQKLGEKHNIGVDHLIRWASELSKVKDTSIGYEMKNLAKRLSEKKDTESVARYVGDLIGTPASEVVSIGGAVMVTGDAISKYVLAQSLMDRTYDKLKKGEKPRNYTLEEAYQEANDTFIDYRQNMPAEIKAMSDYGVLLFPSFWLKAQKVIANLVMYHPVTAVSGYAIADMLDVNSANFLDINIVNRIVDGKIVSNPTDLFSWDMLSAFN
jgi:hypothetical protein